MPRRFEDLPAGTWCKLGPSAKERKWEKDWKWLKAAFKKDGITYADDTMPAMKSPAATKAAKPAMKAAAKKRPVQYRVVI